jgi:F-type H+-transporting ATPase subunit b
MMRRAAMLLCATLLAAASVAAAEGESADPVQTPLGSLFRWINSAVVVGFFVWMFRKLSGVFHNRRQGIAASIEVSAKAKAEADRKLREVEEKLARLDGEVAAMRKSAEHEAAMEAERIRLLARDEAAKVERAADAEIEASERAARMELKALVARLAVERAEALLRKRMVAETPAAVFRGFVDDLARSVN